jgi:S-adenosylmethionine-dependent methyltransferase
VTDRLRARNARSAVRTAVVWDVLRGVLADCSAALGRAALQVVDAGGGTGGFAVPLAELGHQVTVVDPSPDALAALERRAAEAGVTGRVRAVQGDAAGLLEVVDAASADALLCHGVLEVVDDPAAALAAVAKVLRPGGAASVLVANRHAVVLSRAIGGHFDHAQRALSDPAGRWGDHDPVPRRFDLVQMASLMTAAGFTVTQMHGVRVFSDLVPGALVDGEPGAADALLALEAAASEHPAFREIATQLHVLASRHS